MIQQDKKLHFAGNLALFVLGAIVAHSQGGALVQQLMAGALLASMASLAKELVWDLILKRGHASWADMLANALGQAAGAVIVALAWLPTS